jgi:hypothetical protein
MKKINNSTAHISQYLQRTWGKKANLAKVWYIQKVSRESSKMYLQILINITQDWTNIPFCVFFTLMWFLDSTLLKHAYHNVSPGQATTSGNRSNIPSRNLKMSYRVCPCDRTKRSTPSREKDKSRCCNSSRNAVTHTISSVHSPGPLKRNNKEPCY